MSHIEYNFKKAKRIIVEHRFLHVHLERVKFRRELSEEVVVKFFFNEFILKDKGLTERYLKLTDKDIEVDINVL